MYNYTITNRVETVAFITLICILNGLSVKIPFLGILITVFEYFLVYKNLLEGKNFQAFTRYVIFSAICFEMDAFLYSNGEAPFTRWSFINVFMVGNLFYCFTSIVIFFQCWFTIGQIVFKNQATKILIKMLTILTVTGLINIIIEMLTNDNNIMSSTLYPTAPITIFILHFALCSLLLTTIIYCEYEYNHYIEIIVKNTLLSIAISSVFFYFLGYTGRYGDNEEMLFAPLASAFIPPLLYLFMIKRNTLSAFEKSSILITTIFIIAISIVRPNVVGSKWYFIIALSFLMIIFHFFNIKRLIYQISLGLFVSVLFVGVSASLLEIYSDNSFFVWKFSQLINTINIFSFNSFQEWFANLDESPAYRIDEVLNTFIEYTNKPFYALFGKGFAGTTLHYTTYLPWDGMSADFPIAQAQLGAYYSMHESVAVIFLRHGFVGIVFLFWLLKKVIEKVNVTPYSLIGFIWLFFYWSYGSSLQIGAVALILSLYPCTSDEHN